MIRLPKPNSAFTLVELIVVIAILAILWTIGFLSVKNYSSNARDSQRVSDVSSISKSLDYAIISAGSYPAPDNSATMSFSGAPVWYQGTMWSGAVGRLMGMGGWSINKKPVDPLKSTDYRYGVLAFGKPAYSIAADYEGELVTYNSLVPQAYADVGNPKLAYVKGNYNGLVAKVQTGSLTYILALPTISTISTTASDILTLSGTFLLNNQSNAWIPFVPTVVFSGSELPKSDSGSLITNMMASLKAAYSGSVSAVTVGQPVANLLATANGAPSVSLGSTLIGTYLGWSAVASGSSGGGFTCSGTAPVQVTGMTISSVSPANNSTAWTYSGTTTSACTWTCNATYAKSGNTCVPGTYVDDVFSAYPYNYNNLGSPRVLSPGIDMTQGGLWITKGRPSASSWEVMDTARGATGRLRFDSTSGDFGSNGATTYTANGISDTSTTSFSLNNESIAYFFRKAPKFFDVVTYTGDGNANRQLSHSLGVTPGMYLIKRTDNTGDWLVRFVGNGASANLFALRLNTTAVKYQDASPSYLTNSSMFWVGDGGWGDGSNINGATYIAYLFAHDPDTTNGIIQAGSFTTDASWLASVNLGWEPQFLLAKSVTGTSSWWVLDSARGMTDSSSAYLAANATNLEGSSSMPYPTSTGFQVKSFNASQTYMYLAIRRPNKAVTSGSQVLSLNASGNNWSSSGDSNKADLVINRDSRVSVSNNFWLDRVRGWWGSNQMTFNSNSSNAEVASSWRPSDWYAALKRAPWVFDVVAYTWDGTMNGKFNHNLGVVPEMAIIRSRSSATDGSFSAGWWTAVRNPDDTGTWLNLGDNTASIANDAWSSYPPTSVTQFWPWAISLRSGAWYSGNISGQTYVAYLFASKAGVSKVGYYTGNGTSQTIDAGFTSSARFALIKRTNGTGDWYLWDSARGINASANDPHISLNSSAAEVTTDDSVDPNTAGFVVKQNGATNINVTNGKYIYLAFQ